MLLYTPSNMSWYNTYNKKSYGVIGSPAARAQTEAILGSFTYMQREVARARFNRVHLQFMTYPSTDGFSCVRLLRLFRLTVTPLGASLEVQILEGI
jgi:hypothetical protein